MRLVVGGQFWDTSSWGLGQTVPLEPLSCHTHKQPITLTYTPIANSVIWGRLENVERNNTQGEHAVFKVQGPVLELKPRPSLCDAVALAPASFLLFFLLLCRNLYHISVMIMYLLYISSAGRRFFSNIKKKQTTTLNSCQWHGENK